MCVWLQDKSAIIESRKHALAGERDRLSQMDQTLLAENVQLEHATQAVNAVKGDIEKLNLDLKRCLIFI